MEKIYKIIKLFKFNYFEKFKQQQNLFVFNKGKLKLIVFNFWQYNNNNYNRNKEALLQNKKIDSLQIIKQSYWIAWFEKIKALNREKNLSKLKLFALINITLEFICIFLCIHLQSYLVFFSMKQTKNKEKRK